MNAKEMFCILDHKKADTIFQLIQEGRFKLSEIDSLETFGVANSSILCFKKIYKDFINMHEALE